MSKKLMRRCDECEEIKYGFAGFEIKEDENDEWVWICDSKECVERYFAARNGVAEVILTDETLTDEER